MPISPYDGYTAGSNWIRANQPVVVTNVSALRALDKTKISYAVTKGYYTEGDGGAGEYWYDSSDTTSTDNGGTVIKANDNGIWKLLNNGYFLLSQFGADHKGASYSDQAWDNARLAAGDTGTVIVNDGTYLFQYPKNIGDLNTAANFIAIGNVTLKFSISGNTSDCITIVASAFKRIKFDGFTIDCNQTGRDGLVLSDSDHASIRAVIKNSYRDGWVICPQSTGWVENAILDIEVDNAGRNSAREELTGATGAFINEILYTSFEARGWSKITPGARMFYCTSSAGSKFSNHQFLKSNGDIQYSGTGALPSLNIFEVDSGLVENWRFMSCGYENTSGGSVTGGYSFLSSGSGIWNGLTVDSAITNSGLGNLGVHSNVLSVRDWDFSFSINRVDGVSTNPKGCSFRAYLSSTQSSLSGDSTYAVLNSYPVTISHDDHGDINTNTGVFTAPVTGVYLFNFQFTLSGFTSSHINAISGIRVISSSIGGYHVLSEVNPQYVKNSGTNCTISGTMEIKLSSGDSCFPFFNVSGGTKVVGVIGGSNNTGWFAGRLLG